ncbi:hypothetical protein GCM10020256_26060 [Streptomyces thermocoprophilus]
MPVSDLIAHRRADRGDHIAVIDSDGPVTYRELGLAVDRAARLAARPRHRPPATGSSTPAATTVPSSPCSGPPSASAPSSSPSTPS